MNSRELTQFLDKQIFLIDKRTGWVYRATVINSRVHGGSLELSVVEGIWFTPTSTEIEQVRGAEVAK